MQKLVNIHINRPLLASCYMAWSALVHQFLNRQVLPLELHETDARVTCKKVTEGLQSIVTSVVARLGRLVNRGLHLDYGRRSGCWDKNQ